jgi:hypothetical protein
MRILEVKTNSSDGYCFTRRSRMMVLSNEIEKQIGIDVHEEEIW